MTRLWLDVPFSEKDQAKALGAWYDAAARRWYAPRPGMAQLARWAARPPLPVLLPGEDRSFGAGLVVDPCPRPRGLRMRDRASASGTGNACGAWSRTAPAAAARYPAAARPRTGPGRFSSRSTNGGITTRCAGCRRLRRLICLCTWCHTATHYGLAGIRGADREAFAHLLTVTGMSAAAAERHIDDAFALWQQRSATSWSLDLGILTSAGIALARPVGTGATRAQTAARELHRARKAEPAPAPPPAKRTGWPWVNMQGQLDEPRQAQG